MPDATPAPAETTAADEWENSSGCYKAAFIALAAAGALLIAPAIGLRHWGYKAPENRASTRLLTR